MRALVVLLAVLVGGFLAGLAALWLVVTVGLWLAVRSWPSLTQLGTGLAGVVVLAMLVKALVLLAETLREGEAVQR